MTRVELRQLLLDWLDDHYHFGEAAEKIGSDDASFLDRGVLDSLGFVALIVFLEDRFGIRIDRKSLNRENFNSLNQIIDSVATRVGGLP
jgi:acyl carrier protein